ncbi:unnamed protein product [Paramecium sonneborni]|uniref:Uncharacterized protein n=1 Tax=Paramecium sonneborni TaxID=65129 RepID=A0A8S1RK26_9CILI|nr:unnamed protein product [Paramecium sonneborni]
MKASEQFPCPKHPCEIMKFIYFANDPYYNKKLCSICLKEDLNIEKNNVINLVEFEKQLIQFQELQRSLVSSNFNLFNIVLKIKNALNEIFENTLDKINQHQKTLATIDKRLQFFFESQTSYMNLNQIEYYKSLVETQSQFQSALMKSEKSSQIVLQLNLRLREFFLHMLNFEKETQILNQHNEQNQIPQEIEEQVQPLNAFIDRINQQNQQDQLYQTRTLHDQSTYTNTQQSESNIELIVIIQALNKVYHVQVSSDILVGELAQDFLIRLQIQQIYFITQDNVILQPTRKFTFQDFGIRQTIFGLID